MATRQAKVLYDFDGESGTGEISIREGEIVVITRTDVGEGWWEGRNSSGETGLFPEAYVEETFGSDAPPAIAPPPLPQDYNTPAPGQLGGTGISPVEEWSADPWSFPGPKPGDHQQVQPQPPQQQHQQEWGDVRNSNVSVTVEIIIKILDPPQFTGQVQQFNSNQQGGGGHLGIPGTSHNAGSTGDLSSVGRQDGKKMSTTGKTSFNRFSMFVKTGSENYILGKMNIPVPDNEYIMILEVGEKRYRWLAPTNPYSCIVASPKKDSKFKGLKSFIAYQLTPSFNNIQVSRRYKHFDWLHERLSTKYFYIPIPPLPDKQIQGRYEEEFIEHRLNQLQSFVDRICRHPVLSQSEVWMHFLTCTDEKRWKSGKRKAEKDPLVGGGSFLTLKPPEKSLDAEFVDNETQTFSQFSLHFDSAVKNLAKVAADQTTKFQNDYKREFTVIGRSFIQLGQAMEQDGGNYSPGLNSAVLHTGETYEELGKLYEEQPRLDWEHLADMMHDYKGLLTGFPQILHVHSGSVGKQREVEADPKVGPAEAASVKLRSDAVSYALLAEMNTFHEQRVKDLKSSHQQFLKEQIKFYQKGEWIGDSDFSKGPGNFGLWSWCTDSQDGREICRGRLDDFSSILSPAFRAATVFVGIAVIIILICILAMVLFLMCSPGDVFKICGTMQLLSGIFIGIFLGTYSWYIPSYIPRYSHWYIPRFIPGYILWYIPWYIPSYIPRHIPRFILG
ncbi:sorting nexin lst-4 [Eurytemora carolleeae]|uniref:sorting nexin lst-4 n=1 Tax=Eurytemora carolleeae TaxID=1294199 RepID=UPI000C762006|nr:sorting nexin lst-4 [Eurytemora carolleeae]|eukprot:XP_023334885.1 sorting nexin lst-4-like [Eurytemora affinis]